MKTAGLLTRYALKFLGAISTFILGLSLLDILTAGYNPHMTTEGSLGASFITMFSNNIYLLPITILLSLYLLREGRFGDKKN